MQPQELPGGTLQQQEEVCNEQLLQSLREQVKAQEDILKLRLGKFIQQLQIQQQQHQQQHVGSHEEGGAGDQQQPHYLESAAVLEEKPFEMNHREEHDKAQLVQIVWTVHTRAYDAAQEAFEMAGGPEHWPEAATQSYQTITRPDQPVFRRLAAASGAAIALADQLGACHKAEHHVINIVQLLRKEKLLLPVIAPTGPLWTSKQLHQEFGRKALFFNLRTEASRRAQSSKLGCCGVDVPK